MFKKALLTSVFIVGFTSNAVAYHSYIPTVTFGGKTDTQLGARKQKHSCIQVTNVDFVGCIEKSVKELAIVNDTQVDLNFDGRLLNGVKYGGQVTINADTSNNKTNHATDPNGSTTTPSFSNTVGYYTFAYIESAYGRIEAGSNTGAINSLKINAGTIARATGGISGDWRYWVSPYFKNVSRIKSNILMTPDLPTNFDTGGEDKAAKVTYYSPTWYGLNIGVSYIPDTEQHGTATLTHSRSANLMTHRLYESFKNGAYEEVFSGGMNYHFEKDTFKLGLAVIGEIARAKDDQFSSTDRRDNLGAFEVGGLIGYKGFTLAGSYGDWQKSGQDKLFGLGLAKGKQNAKYWNIGASQEVGDFAISIGYMDSIKGNGEPTYATHNNISVGMDYNIAPGFMPYAEISFFNMNQKKAAFNGRNSGSVALLGAKVVF